MKYTILVLLLAVGCAGSTESTPSALASCQAAESAYRDCMAEMGTLDTGDTTSDCDDIEGSDAEAAGLIAQWDCLAEVYASADCSSSDNMQDIVQAIYQCPGMEPDTGD